MSLFEKKNLVHDGLFPCTIGFLKKIEKSKGMYQNRIIKHIENISRLVAVSQNICSIQLILEDSTGTICGYLYYINDSKTYHGACKELNLVRGFYYKIIGALRITDCDFSIVISKIEYLHQRTLINEFLSRTLLALIFFPQQNSNSENKDANHKTNDANSLFSNIYSIKKENSSELDQFLQYNFDFQDFDHYIPYNNN